MTKCVAWAWMASVACLSLAACSNESSIYRTANFDGGTSSITDAKQRVLVNSQANKAWGKNRPKRIICAEPSPDVAQALSSAISASFAGAAQGRGNVSADVSASMSQGIVQLGERLGTIQLLRDGLFRACEAYANGAISDATYSLIVSRVDQTMVALLSSEMAAGAFGRELAAIGGSAGGDSGISAENSAQIAELNKQRGPLNDRITKADSDEQLANARKRDLQDEKLQLMAEEPRDEARIVELDKQIRAQEQAASDARASGRGASQSLSDLDFQIAQLRHASSFASTQARGGGGINSYVSEGNAKYVAQIQENFANQDKVGPLVAACVTALDSSSTYKAHVHRGQDVKVNIDKTGNVVNDGPRSTPLSDVCYQMMKVEGGSSVLAELFKGRAQHQAEMASIRAAKDMFEIYVKSCGGAEKVNDAACRNLGKAFAAKFLSSGS